ncbi:MAG: hypothetical protein UZ16_OP3001000848 [Candidatus Hinthialibacteria bacterium OLB16]|nr:MAG: hypothetical protein UZ16_OP3001000848 [Candidatus Hinthialibacteria bacterium OLB16]
MTDPSRKEWLLLLWKYHLGLLPEKDKETILSRVAQDDNARVDSERVLEMIQQLRQTGHWDFSPDFPEKVLAPLMNKVPGANSRLKTIVIVSSLILAAAVIWMLIRKTDGEQRTQVSPTPLLAAQEPAEAPQAGLPAKPLAAGSASPSRPAGLELKVKTDLFNGAGRPPQGSRELKDPVIGLESELDQSIQGPLPVSPLELHK